MKIAPRFEETEIGDLVLFASDVEIAGWCFVRVTGKTNGEIKADLIVESKNWRTSATFGQLVTRHNWDQWNEDCGILSVMDPRDLLKLKEYCERLD